jgi:hypothetical protein
MEIEVVGSQIGQLRVREDSSELVLFHESKLASSNYALIEHDTTTYGVS